VREQRQILPPRLEGVLRPRLFGPPKRLENPPLDEVVARARSTKLRPAGIFEALEEKRCLPRGIVKNLVLRATPFLELRTSPKVGVAE